MSMMEQLPTELVITIAEYLPAIDLVNWRATCKILDSKVTPISWKNVCVISELKRGKFPHFPYRHSKACLGKSYDYMADHTCSRFNMAVYYLQLRNSLNTLDYFLKKIKNSITITITDENPSEIFWLLRAIGREDNSPSLKHLEVNLEDVEEDTVGSLCFYFQHIESLKLMIAVRKQQIPDIWIKGKCSDFLDRKLVNLHIRIEERKYSDPAINWLKKGLKSSLKRFILESPDDNDRQIAAPTMKHLLATMPGIQSLSLDIPIYNPSHIHWIPETITDDIKLNSGCINCYNNNNLIGDPIPETEIQNSKLFRERRGRVNVCWARMLSIITPPACPPDDNNAILSDFSFPLVRKLSVKADAPFLSSELVKTIHDLSVIEFSTNTTLLPDIGDFVSLLRRYSTTLQSVVLRCSSYSRFESIEGILELCENLTVDDYPSLNFLYLSFMQTASLLSIRSVIQNLSLAMGRLTVDHENLVSYLAVPGVAESRNAGLKWEYSDYISDHLGNSFSINYPVIRLDGELISLNDKLKGHVQLFFPKSLPQERFMDIIY